MLGFVPHPNLPGPFFARVALLGFVHPNLPGSFFARVALLGFVPHPQPTGSEYCIAERARLL
jgi:hypothetical protein